MGLLPPLKRNWHPGTHQVGMFLRTPKGTVIESTHDKPGPLLVKLIELALRTNLTVEQAIQELGDLS
jgi:hypothetical protein